MPGLAVDAMLSAAKHRPRQLMYAVLRFAQDDGN